MSDTAAWLTRQALIFEAAHAPQHLVTGMRTAADEIEQLRELLALAHLPYCLKKCPNKWRGKQPHTPECKAMLAALDGGNNDPR